METPKSTTQKGTGEFIVRVVISVSGGPRVLMKDFEGVNDDACIADLIDEAATEFAHAQKIVLRKSNNFASCDYHAIGYFSDSSPVDLESELYVYVSGLLK